MLTAGVDVGTTSVKAALVDTAARRVLARRSVAYPTARPQPGWAEQDPDDWWRCAVEALRSLPGIAGAEAVAVSGQGSTVCLCDGDGRPLGPAIGWQDKRAVDELARIESRLRPQLRRAHGNLLADAPEPKLVWLRERGQLEGAVLALGAAGIVGVRLGAAPSVSAGDACSFASFDRHGLTWDEEIAAALGVRHLLPPVASAGVELGRVSVEAAVATGLRSGIPIVCSTTDVGAAAIAAGAGNPGDAFYSKGTGGFLCLHVTDVDDPGRLVALAVGRRGVTQLCAGIDTLGAAWDWCRALVGGIAQEEAEALAAAAEPGCGGLVLLPWLQGAQHPLLEPDARGVALGLTLETGRGELLRALLEGTAALLRWNLDASGVAVERIVASGGPTRNALWNTLDASAAGVPLVVVPDSDAAVGSALLAAEAAGAIDDAVAVGAALGEAVEVRPDPVLAAVAAEQLTRARALGDATLPLLRARPAS